MDALTYDLRELIADSGWPPEQIARFRSMCAVASGTSTLSEADRAYAAAIVAALDGRTPGITRAQLEQLVSAELVSPPPGF